MPVSTTERRYRAGPHGYLAWSAIFGGLTAMSVWDAIYGQPRFWEAAALFATLWLLCVVWLAAFEIRITDRELIFRALLGGTRRIRHEEIQGVSLRFDLSGWGGPLRLRVF